MKPQMIRRSFACALAIVTVVSLAFPTVALAKVTIDDNELAQGQNTVGGGTATLSDKILDMVNVTAGNMQVDESLSINFNGGNEIDDLNIGGSAQVDVNFTGENKVEDTNVTDGASVTINADGHNDFEEVNAFDNANVVVNVTGENDFESIGASGNASITVRGTECQKRDIINVGDDERDADVSADKGNVTIDHVTVNLKSETALVGSLSGNVMINTSKIASDDGNKFAEVIAGGTMKIIESVLDITGSVHSRDMMTIEHSDVKAKAPDSKYDPSPYRVSSDTGIKLVREKNGEVKEGKLNGKDVFYVDTGDGKDVDLEADGEPGYYACKVARVVSPKTGDKSDPWGLTALAFAGAATACYAAKRRRDDAA